MYGNRSDREELLFYKADWHSVSQNHQQKLLQTIEAKNGDELLNTSTEDLAKYFAEEYQIEVPEIDAANISASEREVKIDVSQDPMRFIDDRSRPFLVSGTAIDIEIPFVGDKNVFDIKASTFSMNPPRGTVSDGILSFVVQGTSLNHEKVKSEIDSRVQSIKEHLSWLKTDADGFNGSLFNLSKTQIESRKQKLLDSKSLVADLGFKMKERPGAVRTYAAPEVKRKIARVMPKPSGKPYTPEPVLETKDYEHILSVMDNMVRVMEQSPGAFKKMGEEDLRTHFLVQLNGQYEGGATGETFNFEGKTDILIKSEGRNIFIGECKFWTGEKGYLSTIDQLLGYVSWRDTKVALLIFNRNKNFSDVLEKIEEVTPKHKHCKKQLKQISESSWSYLFSQPDDPNREMIISVQIYNIPT